MRKSRKGQPTARCPDCDQNWVIDPALEVECPKCNASVGVSCIPNRIGADKIHLARDELALEMGFMRRCSGLTGRMYGRLHYVFVYNPKFEVCDGLDYYGHKCPNCNTYTLDCVEHPESLLNDPDDRFQCRNCDGKWYVWELRERKKAASSPATKKDKDGSGKGKGDKGRRRPTFEARYRQPREKAMANDVTTIDRALLDEYGLNQVTYRLLGLATKNPIDWTRHQAELKKISGNPAQSLRKLVDRGLLDGPQRGQKISSIAFSVTELGQTTMEKIQRGLHRPSWLSAARIKVLELVAECERTDLDLLRRHKCHRRSITGLESAGYIRITNDPGPGNSLARK